MNQIYANAVLCQKIIEFCCDLFSIRVPYIYYIYQRRENFKLMDSSFQVISYDSRSIDMNDNKIYFDYKEYQMFINMDILVNKIPGITVILRKMRELYQISQIQKLRKNQKIDENQQIVKQWRHAYMMSNKKRYAAEPPIELDKNAFAKYIVYCLFDIELKFKVVSLQMFREHLHRIEVQYNPLELVGLAEKHKIETKVAKYFNMEDFQIEVLSNNN